MSDIETIKVLVPLPPAVIRIPVPGPPGAQGTGVSGYWVPIETFGPVGTADDYATLQVAFSSGQPVELGPRDYLCGSPVTVANMAVSVRGIRNRSRIVFTGETDGIVITDNSDQLVVLTDFDIITQQIAPGTGLTIDRSSYVGTLERNRLHTMLTGMNVRGDDWRTAGWTNCIVMDEVHQPQLNDIFVIGRRNLSLANTLEEHWWGTTETGVTYKSSLSKEPVDPLFRNVHMRYCQSGIRILGKIEGVWIDACEAIACRVGIEDNRHALTGADSTNPAFCMIGCHMNCCEACIKAENVFFSFVSNNLFYEFIYVDLGWTGVSAHHGNGWKISSNEFRANQSSVNTTRGVYLSATNYSSVMGNHFTFCDEPVVLSDADGTVGQTIVRNNAAHDSLGHEQAVVTYDGAVSRYDNPSSSYFGIVAEGSNTGTTISVPVTTATQLAGIPLLGPVGATFRITVGCQVTKGLTAGLTKVYCQKCSGSGTLVTGYDGSSITSQNEAQDASSIWITAFSGIVKIATTGGVQMCIYAYSAGGAASVQPGQFQYTLERLA